MAVKIQLRRGHDSEWSSANPILVPGEPGLESNTRKLKVGDGLTVWNELPYLVDNTQIETNRIDIAALKAVNHVDSETIFTLIDSEYINSRIEKEEFEREKADSEWVLSQIVKADSDWINQRIDSKIAGIEINQTNNNTFITNGVDSDYVLSLFPTTVIQGVDSDFVLAQVASGTGFDSDQIVSIIEENPQGGGGSGDVVNTFTVSDLATRTDESGFRIGLMTGFERGPVVFKDGVITHITATFKAVEGQGDINFALVIDDSETSRQVSFNVTSTGIKQNVAVIQNHDIKAGQTVSAKMIHTTVNQNHLKTSEHIITFRQEES